MLPAVKGFRIGFNGSLYLFRCTISALGFSQYISRLGRELALLGGSLSRQLRIAFCSKYKILYNMTLSEIFDYLGTTYLNNTAYYDFYLPTLTTDYGRFLSENSTERNLGDRAVVVNIQSSETMANRGTWATINTMIAQEEYLKLDITQSGCEPAAKTTCIAVRPKLK